MKTLEAFKLAIALRGVGVITRQEIAEMLAGVDRATQDEMLCWMFKLRYGVVVEGLGDRAREPYLCNRSFAQGQYFGAGSKTPMVAQHLPSIRAKLGLDHG